MRFFFLLLNTSMSLYYWIISHLSHTCQCSHKERPARLEAADQSADKFMLSARTNSDSSDILVQAQDF